MKMFFLLKNNARRGMGEKEYSKRERKRGRKRPPKFANSKTDGRLGGNSQILKAGETLFKNFRTGPDALIMSINRNNRE